MDFKESDRTSGVQADSNRTRSDSVGCPVESAERPTGVRLDSNGLQSNFDGLQSDSDGLWSDSVGLRRTLVALGWTPMDSNRTR